MKKRYFILFLCTIIIIAIVFTTVIVFSNTNTNSENDKVQEEISYIETKILGMINSLNNIPFSNSILLEQNSIKGQSKSQNNQESSSGQSQTSGEGGSSSDSSSSGGALSGSSQNSQSEEYTKYSVSIENILIGIDEEIDWNYLKDTVEILYTSWPTIMIDLHNINIKNEDILLFSNELDTLIVNIENEDKRATANSLAILYSYLPIYFSQFSEDSNKINTYYTKSYIINSYVLLEDDKWDDMQNEITKAQEYFGLIINSINQNISQNNISKSYILLNEMNNAIKLKDEKLYYLKYKNVMESLMNI